MRLHMQSLMIAWVLFLFSRLVPEGWNSSLFWVAFVLFSFSVLMLDKIVDNVEKAGLDAEINVASTEEEEEMVRENERKYGLHRGSVQTKNKREG